MEERLPRAAVPLVTLPPPASGYLPPESQGNDDWYYEDPEYTMPAAPAPKNNPVQRFYAEQEPRTREPVKSALERRRVTPSVAEQPPASARIETPLDNKSFGSDLKSVRLEPDFDKNSVSSRSSYEKAILIYTDVITRNPNVAIAFNNRGVAYAKLGNYTKAIEDFNYALRLNPYYYDAYANCKQVKFTLAIK